MNSDERISWFNPFRLVPPVRDGIRREVERDTVVAGYTIPGGVRGYTGLVEGGGLSILLTLSLLGGSKYDNSCLCLLFNPCSMYIYYVHVHIM